MDLFKMLTNDPVVMFAFGGMVIMLGICAYYVYYFLKNINEDKK
jgi:hypothetical protein